jgi:hypothetical protein
VALNITIVGSVDRQLEELLRSQSTRIRSMPVAELLALAQPSAKQPDEVRRNCETQAGAAIFDGRRVVGLGERFEDGRAAHGSRADGRGDAGGRQRVARRAHYTQRFGRGDRARHVGAADAVHGQISRSSAPRAASARRRSLVNVATALAQAMDDERILLMDFHLSYGDAAVFSALSRGFPSLTPWRTHTGSTSRSSRAWSSAARPAACISLLRRSGLVGTVDMRRIATLLQFAATHYRTFLDVPRSEAAVLDALEGVASIPIVANQELATVATPAASRARCASGMARIG